MFTSDPAPGSIKPKLYHHPSSHYSMIARLALVEARIAYKPVLVDIHLRCSQQSPTYARLNPNMTVPTLLFRDRVLDGSRDILAFAFVDDDKGHRAETALWVDLHYAFPIEELTFAGFLARDALARAIVPRKLAAAHRRLLRLAAAHPDLAGAYAARAAVFAERQRVFQPGKVAELEARRRAEATALLDRLESHLADGRRVMIAPVYGAADVVWTVFLARMQLTGLHKQIVRRPAVARYWTAMQARPSFAAADIWTKLHFGRLLRAMLAG